ncbi:hypothetical protein ACLESD_26165 [Pyxidicoccus sp. 3LFB2]
MKQQAIIAILFLATACSTTTPRISRITETGAKESPTGFFYTLPRTIFQVRYKVSRTEFESSKCLPNSLGATPYSQDDYDDHLKRLGLKATDIKGPGSLTSVSDGAFVIASEPDPDNVFIIEKVGASSFADSMLKLTFGPDGVVQSSELSSTDKLGPAVVKTIEVAGSFVGTIVGMAGAKSLSKTECETLVEQFEARAKDRATLRTNPTPHPKDALELRNAELVAAQDLIKTVFLGLKSVTTSVVMCDVVPKSGTPVEVFSVYPSEGLSFPNDSRCRVPALFSVKAPAATAPAATAPAATAPAATAPAAKRIQVFLKTKSLDETLKNKSITPKDVAGLFYRVPGAAHVEVTTEPFVSAIALPGSRYLITQVGAVRSHPQVSGSNPRISAELYPETGALKSLTIEEKAPDYAAYIGSIGGAGNAVLAGEKTRREAVEKEAAEAQAAAEKKAAAQTPLAQLQAEQALLEAMVAIKEARQALAQEQAAQVP